MSIIDFFIKGPANKPLKHIGGHKVVAENVLDFTDRNVAASDVVEAIKLPKNAVVTHVRTEVITAEGGVVTYGVGDAATPTGWDAAVDGNAEAGIIVGDGAYAANGKRYTAADTIDVIPSADLDTAVIYVSAEYYCREEPQD